MAKKKKEKERRKAVKDKEEEEEFWTDELVDDMYDEELENIDKDTLKYTKIKDLEVGMEDINIEATIDFVGDVRGKDYGEDPFALGFLKDGTGEVKITFWGDDVQKAKPGKRIRIIKCSIGEYRGQLQVYPNRQLGIEFI